MDSEQDSLSQEELVRSFGPLAEIEDELALPEDDDTIDLVDSVPGPVAPPRGEPFYRSLHVYALLVAILLGVQTAHLVLRDRPSATPPPVVPAPVDETPPRDQFLVHALQMSRNHLDEGLYQDVVDLLTPLTVQPGAWSREQQLQMYTTLALAHRRLGNAEEANSYTLRATDAAVERQSAPGLLAATEQMRVEGRFAEARQQYFRILGRSDGLPRDEQDYRILAEIRLADTFFEEARARGSLPPLPGLRPREDGP